jgi:Spy/CpxP family protein refolding chaperone
MNVVRSVLFATAILAANAAGATAQAIINVHPNAQEPSEVTDQRDFDELSREVFAPITDELNLSTDQKLKVAGIISITILKAGPLYDQLDDLDEQLASSVFQAATDESRILQLASEEAAVMARIVALKTLAKLRMVQLLTPEQRNLVSQRLGSGRLRDAGLGAISQ